MNKCYLIFQSVLFKILTLSDTGTGKTYTMLGTNDDPGIMALALNEIFTLIRTSKNKNWVYTVVMSYLEVVMFFLLLELWYNAFYASKSNAVLEAYTLHILWFKIYYLLIYHYSTLPFYYT